jgi:hypothetical protein
MIIERLELLGAGNDSSGGVLVRLKEEAIEAARIKINGTKRKRGKERRKKKRSSHGQVD